MKHLMMIVMALIITLPMTIGTAGVGDRRVPPSLVPSVSGRYVERPVEEPIAILFEEEEQEEEPEPVDRYATQRAEYPEATYVWEYLQNQGYNDYVCAGIVGNIMVEVGGHTLAIQPNIDSKIYAGMCQWALKYYPETKGLTLEEQCVYLTNTIQKEFKTFGGLYQKGFTYDKFLELTDCKDAALAFAKVYERCSSGGYSLRQSCAVDAYNYFTEGV